MKSHCRNSLQHATEFTAPASVVHLDIYEHCPCRPAQLRSIAALAAIFCALLGITSLDRSTIRPTALVVYASLQWGLVFLLHTS